MSNTLMSIGASITKVILPIFMVLGLVTNSLNIFILTRSRLYKYPSSHYFLAMSINSLYGSSFLPLSDLLSYGYHIDLVNLSLSICRFVRYANDLCGIFAPYFIVLASIDRYWISSSDSNRLRWNNIRSARIMIISVVIFFSLFYINTLLLIELNMVDGIGCAIRPRTIYHRIYPLIQILFYIILAPTLIIIFGLRIIYNARLVHQRVLRIRSYRRTDRQLGLMLLLQVTTQSVLITPISILYLLFFFSSPQALTSQFYFIFLITRHIYQFSYVIPFFLYMLTGQTFRKELIRLFKRCILQRRIHPLPNRLLLNRIAVIRIDLLPANKSWYNEFE